MSGRGDGGDGGKTGQMAGLSCDAVLTEDSASPGGARELGWPSKKLSQLRQGAGLVTSLLWIWATLTPPRKGNIKSSFWGQIQLNCE